MSTTVRPRPAPPAETPFRTRTRDVASPAVVVALLTVLAGLVAGGLFLAPQAPGEDSVEVGFARDMSTHHGQAVAMAEAVRGRSSDPEIRALAADIALTQQGQIGIMSSWLDTWGRTASSTGPRMAWMGEPTTGLMPGMASQDEQLALSTLPPQEAEVEFLRLMLTHHAGGIAMAQAGAAAADDTSVVSLAERIANAQSAEIETLTSMLQARGVSVTAPTIEGHHGSGAPGHHGGSATSLRSTALLGTVTLGGIALLWLLTDSAVRRLDARPRRLGPAATGAALGGTVTAVVHVVLAPAHAEGSVAYGILFVGSAMVAMVGVATVLAGAHRAGAGLLGAVSVLLVLTYALFRVIAPPGAEAPEEVDAWGVLSVLAELAVIAAAWLVLARRRGDVVTPRPLPV